MFQPLVVVCRFTINNFERTNLTSFRFVFELEIIDSAVEKFSPLLTHETFCAVVIFAQFIKLLAFKLKLKF